MLDGTRDAVGYVQLRRDRLAGLADLELVGVPASIRGRTRGADGRAQTVGQRLDHAEAFRPTHASTTGDHDRCLGQLRTSGALFLDPLMVYTCAYYREPDGKLEQAQEDKLDLVCRKLRLKRGETLLDIGCGWGSLAIWATQHYDVRAHGVPELLAHLAGRMALEAAFPRFARQDVVVGGVKIAKGDVVIVSLSGANTFEVGNIVSPYSVTTSGAINLSSVSGARLQALTNLLALPHPNLQVKAYADVGQHALQTGSLLTN